MHHARSCVGLLAVLAAVLVSGTRCERPASNSPAAASKPRIALIMKSLANEFFLTMENGARAHQKSHSAKYALPLLKTKSAPSDRATPVDLVTAESVGKPAP